MELTPLRQFLAIAREQHMTRAAQRLGVTQPALSSAMKRLEAELGTPLFHRTGHGVELTAAGTALQRHAEEAVNAADAGERAVRELLGLEQGAIAVGGGATATGHILPGVVHTFREQYPDIRFSVREASSRAVAEAVLAGQLDLGVITEPTLIPGGNDLMSVAAFHDELRLIVPKGHPLEGRRSFRWRDVVNEPFVAFEAGSAVRRVIDDAALAAGVTLDAVMELRSIDAIRRMVDARVGLAFISQFALEKGEGLRCADGALKRKLSIIRRTDRVPSTAAGVFEGMLLKAVGG